MSETLEPMATELDQKRLAEQLLAQAKEQGVELVGPNGLLNQLTKNVLETALDAEMVEHLGYDKHDPVGRGSGNSRNGTRSKTVFTEIGPVQIEVPRDTNSSFEPQIVKKRQRRLTGIDEIVLSLTAKGLTTGEIAAHFADIYGATVSRDTISRITDKVVGEMAEWCSRPLEPVYPVVFIDAIFVKVRDGQVTNRPIYVAVGVSCAGERDILGWWAGDGGEGAKFWLAVLTEIKNRGTADVCMVVCDGLKGLSDAITAVWDRAIVQTSSIDNERAGMVSAFTCTTTGRTRANASPSRSTCRPVRPWWLRGMDRPARAAPPVSAASAEMRFRPGPAVAA
jgi:transposase-like protein